MSNFERVVPVANMTSRRGFLSRAVAVAAGAYVMDRGDASVAAARSRPGAHDGR